MPQPGAYRTDRLRLEGHSSGAGGFDWGEGAAPEHQMADPFSGLMWRNKAWVLPSKDIDSVI